MSRLTSVMSVQHRLLSLTTLGDLPGQRTKWAWSSAPGLYTGRKHNPVLHPLQSPSVEDPSKSLNINFCYASGNRVILLDDLGVVQDVLEHSNEVVAVAWSHVIGYLAVATADKVIHLYAPVKSVTEASHSEPDFFSRLPNSLWHHELVVELDFLPQTVCWFHRNESLYLVAAGSEISIWKVEQIPRLSVGNLTWHTSLRVHIHGAGKHEPEEPTEDNFSVNFVDISSDGRFFSVSITDSRFVFVWDILSDHHMPVELAHTSPVISMDWHLNTRDPYAGSLPSVLKTHCSDGHIFFWKQSPILDHHAHAHHPLESTSQTLSRTRNPSASILSKLSDLGSSGDLKKFEFNASATQDGEELKSGMSTPTQFHAHFSMFCALEIDMSSTPVQMKDSESGKTTSVKCKFVSSSWIENLGVRPYATDTLSKMHLVTAEAKKVHKPSDVTTTPARSTVKWTRPNLKKKKSIAIISAMKPAVSNSPVPLVKHSHFQLQFHKLRHRDIGKKMKKTMSSRPSRDPFTTDTEDVSSVDGEQSRMSLFGRAVDEELDSALAEARKKTISSEDMLDPIEDDKSDSEDSLDFHPIFEQRNRLFFENDQVNRKSTTRDGDCKAWIAVLSSNRSLAIFCIENLFRDHPGASRVFQFTCLPDFVNHSVLQESPISLFSSSLFTTNFMWERPPAKDFDRAIFANKGFAPAPNSLNVYYISKNIEGLVTFRSFSARLNERNSDLTSKLIGHRSIIHRCLNHPFAPYLAIQSLNGRLSIWKHDFPHMLTAMDQQSFGAGMSHWTSLTDALTFSSFCWFPARSKIAILCLERNSSLVKLFEPSTSNVFPQNDDKWQCTQSFDLQLENVQTIKAVVVDLKSTVSRKQSDPSLVKKSSDPIGTRTLSQRVILLAQSPDRIRVVWLHQTNADLDSPYQATIVEDILNEWKGDFITFDVQASIPRKSAVGGGLKRGMDLVCSTSAGNLVHVHSQRVAADNVHDSSIQLIKHELERLGETVRISSINICSGNFFATSTGKVVTLWQLSSLDSFKYQKSYEVYPESSSNSLIYSVVTLGDGIVRLATTEVPPKEAKGSSDNIVISLHLPLRGSYGREAASKIRSSWRTIKIDLSRFLHRYHRYARGMSIKIIGLRFTPYGTLCVVLEDSLCYIPAHRLFLQDESTSILPVPFYHPALIMEMMVNGKIEGTKTLLKFLSQKLTKNLPFNAPFPQTSLESVLEKFSGNESFQPVINDFTESDSAKLEEYISENLLPFIGRRDNLQLLAVLNTLRDIETLSRSLDPFGVRFLVAFKHGSFLKKSIQKGAGSVSLSSVDFAWAFHSTVQDSLLDIVINDQFDLDYAAFLGLGYWLQNPRSIKVIIEKLAVKEYQKRKNPLDSVLFYAALDKVSVLLGLFKADRGKPESEFMGQFLSKDFSVKENRDLAMNYAFGFMRKQKYKAAASFMLIARNQDYAIRIIARNMGDYPLAIMFCRLFGRGSPSDPLFQEIVQDVILDHALKEKDLWLAHLAFWILDKKTDAVNCVMNYDPDSIIFRPDVAFFIAQLSNSAVARSKGFDRKFTTRETNSIAFEAAAEYLRFGWAFLALEQLFSIRDEENVNVVSISSLMTLSSNDDEDEKDYSDKLFVGFSLSQLQQDIIDLFIATRASLKPYQGPYERYHLKKLREKWENLMRLQAVEVISLKPKEKNPFGFTFDALDDSEDEEEPKVVDTAVNPSSTDLANDEELKNFVPTIARRSLLEEINLLANYFNFDIVRTTSSLKRFVRSHHMFLHYLDIQVEAGESKSLHGFINSEFQSLISLVTSSNFLELPFNRSRRLISSALILSKWQNDLKTWTQHPEAEPLPTAFEFSDNMTVKCLIWTSLCIALLSRKKFSILHRLLSSKENDYLSVVEQLSQDPEFSFSGSAWIEQYKYDYGDYEFLHERKFAEHEQEVEKVKEGLYTLLVIRRFMSRFRERYLFRHDEMLQTDPNYSMITPLYCSLLKWWDSTFFDFVDDIEDLLLYCKKCVKFKMKLSDVFAGLMICSEEEKSLFKDLDIKEVAESLSEEIKNVAQEPSCVEEAFHKPVEVFKISGDLTMGVVCNVVDPLKIAISSGKCLYEINTESSLLFRKRSPETLTLLDEEHTTWEGALHRFNQQEAEGLLPYSRFAYSDPVLRGIMLTRDDQFRNSQLPKVSQLSYLSDPMYDGFAHHGQTKLQHDADRRELFTVLSSHPTLPVYISVSAKDKIHLWQFEWPDPVAEFINDGLERITRMKFSSFGTKLAGVSANGKLSLWKFHNGMTSESPIQTVKAHSRIAWDLAFLNSDSIIATAGSFNNKGNVRIFDMLLPPKEAIVMKYNLPSDKHYATALAYVPDSKVLISGGNKGRISCCDMRNGEVVAEIAQAHHGRVHVLQYDSYRNVVVSGGIDGVVKVWNATDFGLVQEFPPCFEKRTLFNHPAAGGMVETFGVTDIAVSETGYFASGSDGTIQYFKARAL